MMRWIVVLVYCLVSGILNAMTSYIIYYNGQVWVSHTKDKYLILKIQPEMSILAEPELSFA